MKNSANSENVEKNTKKLFLTCMDQLQKYAHSKFSCIKNKVL